AWSIAAMKPRPWTTPSARSGRSRRQSPSRSPASSRSQLEKRWCVLVRAPASPAQRLEGVGAPSRPTVGEVNLVRTIPGGRFGRGAKPPPRISNRWNGTSMTLEGWVPQIGEYLTVAEVIEFAFDYRGNTTIVKTDGTEIVGYIFNRDARVSRPFIQFFDEKGE